MMQKSKTFAHVLEFKSCTRDNSDHSETIDPLIEQFWRKTPEMLRRREYVHKGCSIRVDVNWQRLANRIRSIDEVYGSVSTGGLAPNSSALRRVMRPLKIPAKVTICGENDISSYQWYPTFFVEAYLHEVFLVANLAVPGSANFYSLTVTGQDEHLPAEVRLTQFAFENAWIDSLDGKWPTLQALPGEDVCEWFKALDIGYKQRAETGIEKALYVLLHLAKGDARIDSITWIFHGLEALVSTRVGESVSGMVRRLGVVLELDAREQKLLNQRLRKLYDLRSSFVHGGYAVPHPVNSEVIDRSLDGHMSDLYELTQFGAALLIATLQSLIKKRIVKLGFEESIVTTTF
jgi:hypothetical protein